MARPLGQVVVRTSDPLTSKELDQLAGKLTNPAIAISPKGRVIALLFDFDSGPSYSASAEELVRHALEGIKEPEQVKFLDGIHLRAHD